MAKPSSSSSSTKFLYDVYLSFRGGDTRNTFTSYLYDALKREGIKTFKDDEGLNRGEEIGPALLKAIEDSRLLVIIFSKHFASSSWCLDEVAKIIDCFETSKGRQQILPVFYYVDPSHVRHQAGRYGDEFAKHEEKLKGNEGKVKRWRDALTRAANFSGWNFHEGPESSFVKGIVEEICKKVRGERKEGEGEEDEEAGRKSKGVKRKGSSSSSSSSGAITENNGDGGQKIGVVGMGGIGKTKITNKKSKHSFQFGDIQF